MNQRQLDRLSMVLTVYNNWKLQLNDTYNSSFSSMGLREQFTSPLVQSFISEHCNSHTGFSGDRILKSYKTTTSVWLN